MAEQIIDVDLQPSQASFNNFKKFFNKVEKQEFEVDADYSQAEKATKDFVKTAEKQIEKGLGDSFNNVNKQVESSFGNIKNSFSSIGDSLTGGLIGGGVAGGIQLAADALINGATAALEFSREITTLQNNIANLTGLQGSELTDFAARIKATSETFGEDSNEIFKSAQKLAAQTGEDINVVLDNLQKGFIGGANSSGELLAVTQEYGNVIKEVGGNSEDLIKILQRSEQTGVFSDKGIDVIKEFGLRIRELPQSTKDALKGIGLDAADIQSRLESGQANVLDILSETSTALSQLPAQSSAVGTAIADIFGGPGEDAGLKYLLTLKDINQETNGLTDNLTEAQKRQVETLRNSERFNTIFIDLFGGLSSGLTDFLNNLKSGFLQVLEIVNLGDFFTGLKAGFSETFETAKPFFDFLANVAGVVIVATIERIKLIFSTVESIFSAVINAINPIFVLIEDITKEFDNLFGSVEVGFNIFDLLKDTIDFLIKLYLKPLEIAIKVIVEVFRFFFNLLVSGITIVKEFINENKILQSVFKVIGDVAGFVGSAIRSLLETLGLIDGEKTKKELNKVKNSQQELKVETESLNTELPKLNDNIKQTDKVAKEITLDGLVKQLAILKINGKETSAEYAKLIEQAFKLKTTQDELSDAVKAVNEELANYGKTINVVGVDTSALAETSKQGFDNIANSIKSSFDKNKKAIAGFGLIAAPVFDDLADGSKKAKPELDKLAESVSRIGGEFSNFGASVFKSLKKVQDISDSGKGTWQEYGKVVANVFGDAAQLAGENVELQRALSATQAIINTAVAVTMAYKELGPVLGIPAGIAIAALGALQVAKIYGAEDGVIGLDGSYNKKPGKTDTLPFLLAPGESVINSKATSINKPFLEYANKGGDLGSLFGGMASKIDITNERLISLEKAMYKAKFSKQSFNLVVENKNNSKISGAVRV